MTLTIGQIDDFRQSFKRIMLLSFDIEQLEMGVVRISLSGYNFYVERTKREVERESVSIRHGTSFYKEEAEMFLVTDEQENEVCCVENWEWVLGEVLAYIARHIQDIVARNRVQHEEYLSKKGMKDEIDEDAREDYRESQRVRSEI